MELEGRTFFGCVRLVFPEGNPGDKDLVSGPRKY